ncbi:zinc ribbon domain-containing protein [Bacillus sp. E214]|uniref:zinc ribbon domain-containing protein n=1 Tax=Bacillus sp. E214 TaxID=2587156 RepID=UPI0011DF36DA|nr:zinc ribbon domain-containing protein [Bacillus sp. E214]
MALIRCPECGKEISDTSEVCINCGYKLLKKDSPLGILKKFNKKILLSGAAILVIVVWILTFFFQSSAKGEWWTEGNSISASLTLNSDGTADILYLRGEDEDDGISKGIVLAESATWEQDGEKVTITYKPTWEKDYDNFNVHLIYGKDADGDECLISGETGDRYYRTFALADTK